MWRGTAVIADSTTWSAIPWSWSRSTIRDRVRAEVMPMPSRVIAESLPQPRLDARHQVAVREVDLQRRHGDVIGADGVKVGALARVRRLARGANPVDGLAARILRADHVLRLVPPAKASHDRAAKRVERYVGHVDVEQPCAGGARAWRSTMSTATFEAVSKCAAVFDASEMATDGMP